MKKNKILSIIISATCLVSTAASITAFANVDKFDGFIYGDANFAVTGTTACGTTDSNYTMTAPVENLSNEITAEETVAETPAEETTEPVTTPAVTTATTEVTADTITSVVSTNVVSKTIGEKTTTVTAETTAPRVTVETYIAGTRPKMNSANIEPAVTTTKTWYVASYRPKKTTDKPAETPTTSTSVVTKPVKPAIPAETEHVHSWKNVYNTVDIYEDQPVYEEVPVYEERPIREVHWFMRQPDENGNPIDRDLAYAEYVKSGGTLSVQDWYLNVFNWDPEYFGSFYQKIIVIGTEQVPVGTEMKPTGETKKIKTGTKQEYDHKVCTTCGEEQN